MLSQLFLTTACLFGVALSFPESLRQDFDSLDYRPLKAAKRHADILKRSTDIVTKKAIVLTYAEDAGYADDKTFAARVHLGGHRETLFLEEFEHLLESVDCSESTMTLGFHDNTFFGKARDACASLNNGLVVSSHSSCSESNAHSVFNVSSIEYDEDNSRIVLGIHETTWMNSFRHKKIEFGQTSESHYLHRHDRLSRRDSEPTSTALVIASAAVSLVPTSTPTAESVTFDLSNDQTDTTFQWPGGIEVGPPFPITVGCKKCTTKGQLVLTQGEIVLTDLDDLLLQGLSGSELDFIETGFFQLELNGFESSILLKASPSTSVPFTYDLFSIPVFGFKIPGFGAAGVLFQPQLAFDIQISGGIELTWGFKVNVPDKSTIRLDVGQFNQSRVDGFDQTTVESLPFNANASDIQLNLKAGLRPFMPIGMSFFDDQLTLLGGPFLDLPYINTTMTQLATSNVNTNCEAAQGQTNSKFQDAFKNLTHIESNLGMSVGFEFEAKVKAFDFLPARADYNIWSTTAALPTACLAWGKETGMAAASIAEKKLSAATPAAFGSLAQLATLGLCVLTAIFAAL